MIGAGKSGLIACKILHERQVPFDCFDAGSQVTFLLVALTGLLFGVTVLARFAVFLACDRWADCGCSTATVGCLLPMILSGSILQNK